MSTAFPMEGIGFFVWKLQKCMVNGNLDAMMAALDRANAKWVCIKVANGTWDYNTIPEIGGDNGLRAKIEILQSEGFKVGGWPWVCTSNVASMNAQAGKIGERVRVLGLDFVQIDAEQNAKVNTFWKTSPDRKADAAEYVNSLRGAGIPLTMPVALCTYRFPSVHPQFPYKQFLDSESVRVGSPQVYWAESHNAGEQLERSIIEWEEYQQLDSIIPIGAAYNEKGWEPTTGEIRDFMGVVNNLNLHGVGFWVLDQAMYRPEWLDAIAGMPYIPPDPEPEPEPGMFYTCYITQDVNYRSTPKVEGNKNLLGTLRPLRVDYPVYQEITGMNGIDKWCRIGIRPGKSAWVARIWRSPVSSKIYEFLKFIE